jgi:hypothetical protein
MTLAPINGNAVLRPHGFSIPINTLCINILISMTPILPYDNCTSVAVRNCFDIILKRGFYTNRNTAFIPKQLPIRINPLGENVLVAVA